MEREHIIGKMVVFTRVSIKMEGRMALVCIIGQMADVMRDIGVMDCKMAKVCMVIDCRLDNISFGYSLESCMGYG